jgi:hypothetical protein
MADPLPPDSPEAEARFHTYRGHDIPIYVRLMWVAYYCLAIFYVLIFLFPSLQRELAARPAAPANKATPAAAK